MEEIKLEEMIINKLQKLRESVNFIQVENGLRNPKLMKLYEINKKNHEIAEEIEKQLKIKEELKQAIDEHEDSLVEYSNLQKFEMEKQEKHILSMKELNESYRQIVEKERNSFSNTHSNNILKFELSKLIEQRNSLLLEIGEVEKLQQNFEQTEEKELKTQIKYLKKQLKIMNC
jgi:hypothetical protein